MKPRGAKKSQKGKKKDCVEVELEVMDVELWKHFPEELIEAVIARLPIPSLFWFRLVCRKWNSPYFQQLWSNSPPQKHPLFFAVAGIGDEDDVEFGALYDPSTKEWRYTKKFLPDSYWCLRIAASAGGLVCYFDNSSASFVVGNCLTQTWKEFLWPGWAGYPSPENVTIGMVTLNQDYSQLSAGTAYKIIWVDGFLGDYWVYDSMKDSTSSKSPPISTGKIPDNIFPLDGFKSRTASINTVVYFLTMESFEGIISYDVVSGAWEKFLIPYLPSHSFTSIAECGGRLLLAALVFDSNPFSVFVLELETVKLCWKEVDRMPSSWCSEFSDEAYSFDLEFDCVGNGRVLLISILTYQRSCIFIYDVVNREWSKAPPVRYPRIEYGVAFVPSLSVSP